MKQQHVYVAFALVCAFLVGFKAPGNKQPFGYIPMYSSQSSGQESILLNVQQITRIVPHYVEDDRGRETSSITVYFTDDEELYIDEPYEEFKDRIRNSMK